MPSEFQLLPLLFDLNATNFYLQYASEKDKVNVLLSIKESRCSPAFSKKQPWTHV